MTKWVYPSLSNSPVKMDLDDDDDDGKLSVSTQSCNVQDIDFSIK